MARFTRFNEETQGESMLFWVRVFASVTGLISAAAFLSLALEAQGAPPAGGFRPGQRTFTNPFVNPSSLPTVNAATSTPPPATPPPTPGYVPTSPSELGEMDEDMSSDMDDGTGNPITPSRGGNAPRQVQINSGRNTADPEDVPNPTKGQAGVSVGGEQPGGVISNSKLDPLAIDSTTGFGSNEIITDFNYPDAEVMDIAKTLGKLTGKNFILDKGVKGKVTIISNSPITVGDAWKAFLTALDINGFTLIPSGKYIRIARQRDARDKQLKTYTGDFAPSTDALITRIFSLKHISADEVARTFRSFMPANSRIIPYDQTNSVIVTDTGSNIDKLAKMLEYLDVEGFDAGIEVIPVKFASAVELSKLIDTLIPGTQTGRPTGAPARPRGFGASGSFAARRTKEGGMINTIIADERTNTLIVHANGKGADQVRGLVAKLDKKVPAPVGGGKIHVVYLQFAKAKDIAATLNNLGGDSGRARPAAPAGTGGVGVNPTTSVLFEGAIKVSSDDSTNSLVITASPADFVTVQRVISKLDIPRDEVYVEAVIMEMIMTKDFEVSTNVVVPNAGVGFTPNGGDLVNFLTNPASQKGLVLGFKAGQDVSIPVNGQNVTVKSITGLIKAIQTNTNSNILATPQILTLDNEKATFSTTEKIPFATSTISTTGTTNSVQREDVGLTLELTPQINKVSNYVKLEINTKLEDVEQRELPAQVANLAVATLSRSAKTNVIVADTDTVVLGGLIRDKQAEQTSKIPLLGDIPLLGWLFRSHHSTTQKTNLLMFITPHIIRHYDKVRTVLDRKLKQRDDFIERANGGKDPQREYRDEMIKGLPDIREITNSQPKTAFSLDEEQDNMRTSSPLTGDQSEGTAPEESVPPATGGTPPPEGEPLE